MKKIFIIFACVMLGFMTSSCIYNANDQTPLLEPIFGYEPATDEAYRSYIMTNEGELSTLIPYVALCDEDYVSVTRLSSYQDTDVCVSKIKKGAYVDNDLAIEEMEYVVNIIVQNYKITYRFSSYEPHCYAGKFLIITPSFEFDTCLITEFPSEPTDAYYLTEIKVKLNVVQDENVYKVAQILKLKEGRDEIFFNPLIDGWGDFEVNP